MCWRYKGWKRWLGYTQMILLFSSHWEKKVNGVLLEPEILKEWVDCRGVSSVPCLRVKVQFMGSNQTAFLHFDEESVLLTPEVRIYGSNFQVLGLTL